MIEAPEVRLELIYQEILSLKKEIVAPTVLAVGVSQAAKMIGVSTSTVYRMMDERDIAYSIIGGKRVIKIKELEEILKRREVMAKRKK